MTEREQQILALIRDDPLISQRSIARKLAISRSAVAGHIMKLTDKGVIKGRGYVLAEQSFVVALGGAGMDVHGAPRAGPRLHDSNPGTVQVSPGGVARNIAENLARLGIDCRLIAAVGNDQYGELLLRHCRSAGIDVRHVRRVDTEKTSTYLSVLDESGDMLVAISDMAATESLDAHLLEPCEAMLRQASAIVLDTNLSDAALAYVTSRFADLPIFVDTVSTSKATRILPYLDAVHTLFPGRIEAEAMSGQAGGSKRGLEDMARWFHERGVGRLFVTLGPKGVFFSADGQQGIRPPIRTAAATINANGAGDAFAAGIIAGWLRERPLADSVEFALAAASLTLGDAATVNPAMSETGVARLCETHQAA